MSITDVEVLILSKTEIENLISRRDVIEAVEVAFKALGTKGELAMPQKEIMFIGPVADHNVFIPMPTYIKPIGAVGIKWVSVYQTQKPGIPMIWGSVIILNDPETSLPYAIMDGTAITNLRTAGGHAPVAAKYLAKKNSKTMAIIGCGFEARTGLPAFNDLFPLEAVKIYDIKLEAMSAYKQEMSKQVSAQIIPSKTAQEAVEGADIVLVATFAQEPVVFEPWIPEGCFVIGLMRFQDLDPMLSKKADKWVLGTNDSDGHLIIDYYDSKLYKRIAVELSRDDVYGDMGEVITGAKPGRENDQERILYTHMGMGAHDVALAQTAFNKAKEKGVGTRVRLI